MTLALAILAAIPAIYGIIVFIQKSFRVLPAQKAEDIIKEVEIALDEAKLTGNTKKLEDIFNK